MTAPRLSLFARITAGLRPGTLPRQKPSQALFDEILYLSTRTQSLEDLLTVLPEHVCAALKLTSFHLFLREASGYVLKHSDDAATVTFPASCSTVSRMRRDRSPASFVPQGAVNAKPDGWQLLAEPFELEILNALHAQLLLPLEGRTGLMGFAALSRPSAAPFTGAELRFLKDLGPEMGRALESAKMVSAISEQAVERAQVTGELELAREVQERLLPAQLPSIAGLQAAAAYRSAGQIGGDYYDVFLTESGAVYGVIADVSGKGVPAALLMASLRASLHALSFDPDLDLTRLVARLNQLIYDASSTSRYATLFLFTWEAASGTLAYVNAGHNPPLLLCADGSTSRLSTGGPVVGLLGHATYEAGTQVLAIGDLLVAYTDGVTEANDAHGAEWEEAGLESAVHRCLQSEGRSPDTIVRSILEQLDEFRSGTAQTDDITILVCARQEHLLGYS